ncbi:hypothetical protein K466DRAFT_120051 [Polyporus arcularius HHB13444]|uniref:Uncharacterized protein n=1 Tax=Polyporus arcularius HHB13444 TaxID=1314778 RepID=A0A5C3PYJ1_9APHY|nr:hypothetical protein K466DRAFT_120051 [Polyporus arcularius HHB13444]
MSPRIAASSTSCPGPRSRARRASQATWSTGTSEETTLDARLGDDPCRWPTCPFSTSFGPLANDGIFPGTMSAVALWPHRCCLSNMVLRVQETCGVPDVERGAVTHCRQVLLQCPSFRPLSGRASGTWLLDAIHCQVVGRAGPLSARRRSCRWKDAICVRVCVGACEERSAHDQALGRRRGAAGSWNAMACIQCTAHGLIEADGGNSYSLRGCSYS